MKHFDTIVLGLGGMGAAASLACAQRGQRVLGLEQFQLGHNQGSSHGQSRIIREVYFEHPAYVPLAQQAFKLWEEIELQAEINLLTRCRCANIGIQSSDIIQGVQQAAHQHQLAIETWSAAELRKQMPAVRVPDDMLAVVEQEAGWLQVEDSVRSMLTLARQHGAELHDLEKVKKWMSTDRHVEVVTDKESYSADSLIITAGPWAGQELAELGLPLRLMRQMQLWFTPPAQSSMHFKKQRFPIFIMDTPEGHFYGIPSEAGPGVKIAQHYGAPELNLPEEVDRNFHENDLQMVRPFLRQYLPALDDAPLASYAACIYTLTPDRHFVVDLHPRHRNVAIACGFSGHGFKFAPVIGRMLADLLTQTEQPATKELFAINRWQQ